MYGMWAQTLIATSSHSRIVEQVEWVYTARQQSVFTPDGYPLQDTEKLQVRPPKSSLRFVQVQQWVDDILAESSSEIRILPAGIEQVKGRRSEAHAHS